MWSSIFPRKFENSAFVGVTWITCFLQTDAYAGAGTVYYSFVWYYSFSGVKEIHEVTTLVCGALLCISPPQWCRTINMCCGRRVRCPFIHLELTQIHRSNIYKMCCDTIVCLSVYLFAVICCFQWLQSAVDRSLLPSPHQPNSCLLKKPVLGHYCYPARWNRSTLKLVSADICVLLCGKFLYEEKVCGQ